VDLAGLGVRIGDTPVLRDLDLTISAGEAVGIHGGNGSGKTTLLRVLATLLAPTKGTGRVLGADLFSSRRFGIRSRIELIGHAPALFPNLTLEENTAFVARIAGKPAESVSVVLDQVGLARARSRRANQCSLGMQRRAEFARVLLTEPDLVLLDEAHAGLDPEAGDLVSHITKLARARGGAAVLVAHDVARTADLVDRSYEVSGGRLWNAEERR
jgi:heme exporter protein A